MKKLGSIFIIVLVLSGCSASWHIKKAIDKNPKSFKTDTTIQEIVFKLDTVIHIDTNILILLPRDTARIDTVIKKLKPYSFKPIYTKNGIINMKASMSKGVLHLSSHLDSAILYHLEAEILIKDALITKQRTILAQQTVTIENHVNELKWYEKWLNIGKYVLIGIVVLILGGIVYKTIKWIKK